jgi:hypothetical protein
MNMSQLERSAMIFWKAQARSNHSSQQDSSDGEAQAMISGMQILVRSVLCEGLM